METESESKIAECQKIKQQLQKMNGLIFDLTESDVEDFQNLLDESSGEESEFAINDSVSLLGAQISVDVPKHASLSVIHEDEAGQSGLGQFSETGQSPMENDHPPLAGRDEDCNIPFRLNFSGESEDLSNFGSNQSSTQPLNDPENIDSQTAQEDDDYSGIEFIPPDAKVPIPCTSKIEFHREFEFDPLNFNMTSQSLIEPSCDETLSDSNTLSIDDSNSDLVCIANTISLRGENASKKMMPEVFRKINDMQSTSSGGCEKKDEFARFVDQENIYNDPVALHNAMHFHFPGECTFVSIIYFNFYILLFAISSSILLYVI